METAECNIIVALVLVTTRIKNIKRFWEICLY